MAAVVSGIEVYLPLAGLIDVEKENQRLNKELATIDKELSRVEGKLGNAGFLAKAPADVIEKEKEVLKQQAMNEGKPEAIAEKMVLGRIKKFYEENCLLEQAFIKDDAKKVAELVKGGNTAINKFAFFVMGEGLEKKSEDLSEEVAKQVAAMKN